MANLLIALPEVVIFIMACVALVVGVFRDHERAYKITQITIGLALVFTLLTYNLSEHIIYSGTYIHDSMASILKSIVLIYSGVVLIYSREYLIKHNILRFEYYVLVLFAVLGMMIMISANSLLTIYLGLELLSLCLYALVAMHTHSALASESAMKYFVLGALASGLLLYGISMIYGVTGTLQHDEILQYITSHKENSVLIIFGLVFLVTGIAFKLGVVPFHMWLPDVYQGSPTCVTLFISSAPKISGFAITIRMLVDGLAPVAHEWQQMLLVLSVLSMAIGNTVAIMQTNIKRMLAYSTIAHMGYLLLGIIAGTNQGYAASMFYVVIYALMSLGTFGMVILLGDHDREADLIDAFKGLASRSPWHGLIMMMLIFSMAGIPPFVGFWAKWFVIKEVIQAGFVSLAMIAVFFSIIGAYYYLKVVKTIYFDSADNTSVLNINNLMGTVISINGLAVFVLGLAPGLLMTLCLKAVM